MRDPPPADRAGRRSSRRRHRRAARAASGAPAVARRGRRSGEAGGIGDELGDPGRQRVGVEGAPGASARRRRRPPAALALALWWSSMAKGYGTRIAGRPTAVSSATVDAPARAMTRWAAARRRGTSSKNGARSTVDLELAISRFRRRQPFRTALLRNHETPAQGRIEPADRRRNHLAEHARALAAAENEQADLAVRRGRRIRAIRAHPAKAGRTGMPVRTHLVCGPGRNGGNLGEAGGDAPDAVGEHPVGAAENGVLLMNDRARSRRRWRPAPSAPRRSRRSRRRRVAPIA